MLPWPTSAVSRGCVRWSGRRHLRRRRTDAAPPRSAPPGRTLDGAICQHRILAIDQPGRRQRCRARRRCARSCPRERRRSGSNSREQQDADILDEKTFQFSAAPVCVLPPLLRYSSKEDRREVPAVVPRRAAGERHAGHPDKGLDQFRRRRRRRDQVARSGADAQPSKACRRRLAASACAPVRRSGRARIPGRACYPALRRRTPGPARRSARSGSLSRCRSCRMARICEQEPTETRLLQRQILKLLGLSALAALLAVSLSWAPLLSRLP